MTTGGREADRLLRGVRSLIFDDQVLCIFSFFHGLTGGTGLLESCSASLAAKVRPGVRVIVLNRIALGIFPGTGMDKHGGGLFAPGHSC